MSVKKINIGQLANDGTGDDIRTAFDKVNDNFEDLNARFPTAASGENLGPTGEGIFESATNSKLSFKKIIGGDNVTLTASVTGITISTPSSLDQLIAVSDNGTITVARGQTMAIQGGTGIATSVTGQNLFISTSNGALSGDGAPALSAQLNANNNNIINGGTITASQFNGPLDGLVYGIDVRKLQAGAGENSFDFGNLSQQYTNLLDFLQRETDVDFGKYINPGVSSAIVDLGTIAS